MKRRIPALLLSLLLSLSLCGPAGLAEELSPAAERWQGCVEEPGEGSAGAEALPAQAFPAEAPEDADAAPEDADAAPEDADAAPEAGPDTNLPEDADADTAEQPGTLPETGPDAEVPEDADTAAPEDADGAETEAAPALFAGEDAAPEEIDLFSLPAVGDAGVAYEGVHYLSQAVYAGIGDEAQRSFYRKAVNALTAALDEGLPLQDVVLSLDADGVVRLQYSVPLRTLFGAAEEAAPAEAVPLPSPGVTEVPGAQEDAPAEAVPLPSPGVTEVPGTQEDAPLTGNVGLAASLREPLAEIGRAQELQRVLPGGEAPGQLRELRTRFWEGMEKWYYKQLSLEEQRIFAAGEAAMVTGGEIHGETTNGKLHNGFTVPRETLDLGELTQDELNELLNSEIVDVVSALILTYPRSFDWMDLGTGGLTVVMSTEGMQVRIGMSRYYSEELERSAQAKVGELVKAALADAQENSPCDLPYGMVRYFDEWICAHNYYNPQGVSGDSAVRAGEVYYYCHNAYGILLKGYGVCESYALTMARLLDAAGIPNLYVTGKAGGGHAWNYVRMNDGGVYLQDSTWNDSSDPAQDHSTRNYLLRADDGRHLPTGNRYTTGSTFSFPDRSAQNYVPRSLIREKLYVARGGTLQLKVEDPACAELVPLWKCNTPGLAKVGRKGKLTALKPGAADVELTVGGRTEHSTVVVYQFSGLTFPKGKSAVTRTVKKSAGPLRCTLTVHQKREKASAEEIAAARGMEPKVKLGRQGIAGASATLSGDSIILTVNPVKKGTTDITVRFGGQTAKLTLRVQ